MTEFLIKKFIKDSDNFSNTKVREDYGKFAGIIGIVLNAILSSAKIATGLIFKSLSITADGINNLTDAASSVITLIGFKLSGKPADKDHPYGHARMEYISGLVVSFIIVMLGINLATTSVKDIFNPSETLFDVLGIIVLVLSILLKLWMSLFNKYIAKKINSSAIMAVSADSRNDAIATSAVLVAAIISKYTGLQLDGFMGLIVSVIIILAGISTAKDTLSPLLGESPDTGLVDVLSKELLSQPDILGVHDLLVHSYGPGRYFATVHAEMDANKDPLEAHDIIDGLERQVMETLGIHLVIHYDPTITDDEETNVMKGFVHNILKEIDTQLSLHDFRVVTGAHEKKLLFDVVIPFHFKLTENEIQKELEKKVKIDNENYYLVITFDKKYS